MENCFKLTKLQPFETQNSVLQMFPLPTKLFIAEAGKLFPQPDVPSTRPSSWLPLV